MKPFNLEAAKRGEPITTRDGRSVRFLAHVPEVREDCRVVVFIDASTCVTSYSEDGRYNYPDPAVRGCDLVMAPRVVWVNLYRNGVASWHDSKEEANVSANYPDEEPIHQAVRVGI